MNFLKSLYDILVLILVLAALAAVLVVREAAWVVGFLFCGWTDEKPKSKAKPKNQKLF